MTLQELLKKLVETEDQMERMALVEANKDLLEATATSPEDVVDYKAKYDELKQKYIDTFFAPPKGEDVPPPEDPKPEELKTIDEVLAGK